jgi:hypothetical protein
MNSSVSRLRIILTIGSLAQYPQGGGHWTVLLQHMLGLKQLGHDVFLLELFRSTGDTNTDQGRIETFFTRLRQYDLEDQSALLLFPKGHQEQNLNAASSCGLSLRQVKTVIRTADLLLNFCCAIRQPLLGMFNRRVLVDLDPGHLQVSGLTVDMDMYDHQAFCSVGKKLHEPDCEVPTLDVRWHTFSPSIYLPMWSAAPDPGRSAPFTSVTHWTWGELWLGEQVLSISKRDAYLKYLDLPQQTGRPFELAANIHPDDRAGDRELLERARWKLVDPWKVANSPAAYQRYISESRAEISCPKPIFKELNTGWFSDRSACYLASGRPVLAEDTGFSDHIPVGEGLLTFRNISQAVDGVNEIDSNYARHMKAARELAEEYLDSRRILQDMLDFCYDSETRMSSREID